MFAEHNGHELAQLDDVTGIVRRNISDLKKLIQNTRKVNDENSLHINKVKEEVYRMREI